jgi:hypothetical protein
MQPFEIGVAAHDHGIGTIGLRESSGSRGKQYHQKDFFHRVAGFGLQITALCGGGNGAGHRILV